MNNPASARYTYRHVVLAVALILAFIGLVWFTTRAVSAPIVAHGSAAPLAQAATPTPSAEMSAFLNDAPFPRTYMFYHKEPTVKGGPLNEYKCPPTSHKTWPEEMGLYATVLETHMQYGANDSNPVLFDPNQIAWGDWDSIQPWRIPDDNDPDGVSTPG
ncbi:MAG: hypothetical protein J5I90_18960 [Caldilineales bacterium]|nr:hypothetical protein [Caldilineales bacterium]